MKVIEGYITLAPKTLNQASAEKDKAMGDQVTRSLRDFDSTRQTTSFAVDSAASPGQRLALANAINLWSAGEPDGHIDQYEISPPVGIASSNPVAQESVQVIVEMKDAVTGTIYRERIPQAYLDKPVDIDTDPAWTVSGQGGNSLTVASSIHTDYNIMKNAVDAIWRSPNGNAGTMERMYIEK